MSDVWLRGGLVVDGTGAPPRAADVRIQGDVIAAVVAPEARPDWAAAPSVECAGLVIVPGFIDIHTHSDLSFLLDPAAPSKVVQGVTTEVVGNCGFSAFPVSPPRREALDEFLRGLGTPQFATTWTDFDGYAQALERCRPVMNVASLVGHGALRIRVAGTANRAFTAQDFATMVRDLRSSLEQGAFGMSTGLTYVPSTFADVDEIHALGSVLAEYGALYATHSRATPGLGAFDEAIDVARLTGARVQFSHVALNDPAMWGRAGEVIGRFERARSDGADVTYDIYPYAASASSLTQYLPGWVQERGDRGLEMIVDDQVTFRRARDELARGLFGSVPWDWGRVLISLAGPGDEELEGLTVADAATRRGLSPEGLCLHLCARHGNLVQVILFYRTEADVAEFLAHPLAIIGSDGRAISVTEPGRPHPRSFGAHARLLEKYVADTALSLEDAVHKSTLAAARRLGISDRGRIAPGARADLAALDLDAIHETATWTRPCQLARGVRDVWVNGEHVVGGGALTGARPGRVLRRQ